MPPLWFGWALYLACSWTWCIGMFLPALLVRDHGLVGYVIFALTNITGAIAMGWVLSSREASQRLVQEHKGAVHAFTIVTVAFHLYWIGWLSTWISTILAMTWPLFLMTILLGVMVIVVMQGLFNRQRLVQAATIALAVSGVMFLASGLNQGLEPTTSLAPGSSITGDWFGLLLVSVLGFGCCPYLDATFHHARQQLGRNGGRAAFSFGFGVVFAGLILLSFVYAGVLIAALGDHAEPEPVVARWLAPLLLLHLLVQASFTCQAHLERLRALQPNDVTISATAVLWGGGLLLGVLNDALPSLGGLTPGELGYRTFLGFYGLLAPAYLMIFILCNRKPDRIGWLIYAAVTLSALWFFWIGFVERREIWLIPGVLIVVSGFVISSTFKSPASGDRAVEA